MNAPDLGVRTIARPQFGQPLAGEGGRFVGVMKGDPGKPDYLLILHEEHRGAAPWKDQMNWAKGLTADGHADFRLPTRRELHALIANAKDQFEERWYWSCEQHASYPDYAWYQDCYDGYQGSDPTDDGFRARAVRSVILQ